MLESIKKEWSARIALVFLLLLTTWWIVLRLTVKSDNPQNQLFAAIYGIVALWGGSWGLFVSRQWGFLKSLMGKALLFFSLGLFFQEFGQLVYSYYIYYQHIDVPYPSIGDIGYFGSIPLYVFGIIFLAEASGVRVKLRSFTHQIIAFIIPAGMLSVGYFLFLQGYVFDWTNPLKIFLDFGYPFGEAIYISLAITTYLLSRGVLGGIMRPKILFILFALCVQFLADYTFLYQSSKGTWFAGGINDYIYLCSYFAMTIGLIQFDTVYKKLRKT